MSRDLSRVLGKAGPSTGSVNLAEDDAPAASPPLQSGADRANVRLDLLRLTHRYDLSPEQIIDRTRAFEAYVFGEPAADKGGDAPC